MFKPTLLSRAVERAYGIEHPIGDPFGGAAYGARDKGSFGQILSSIVPMVAGAAMMLTPAAPMGAMLIGGAMMAGGAMSGIGALTGNRTLSKIGGITSAVAGVAGLGYSVYTNWDSIAGALSSGAEQTAGSAATAAVDSGAGGGAALNTLNTPSTAATLANTPSTVAPTVSGAYDTGALAGEFSNQMNLASQTPVNLSTGNMLASAQGTVDAGSVAAKAINDTSALTSIGGGSGLQMPGAAAGGLQMPGSTAGGLQLGGTGSNLLTGSMPEIASSTTQNLLTSGIPSTSMVGGASATSAPAAAPSGLLSSVGNFINKNPVVSLMGLQSIAGLAEGASPKSQAEGEYLQAMAQLKEAETNYINSGKSKEAEAEFNRAKAYEQEKRDAYNLSITQMTAPDINAALQNYNPGGLINGARA